VHADLRTFFQMDASASAVGPETLAGDETP
jgi:hypothetical protein